MELRKQSESTLYLSCFIQYQMKIVPPIIKVRELFWGMQWTWIGRRSRENLMEKTSFEQCYKRIGGDELTGRGKLAFQAGNSGKGRNEHIVAYISIYTLSMIILCSLWCGKKSIELRVRNLKPYSSCTTKAVWPWKIHIVAMSLSFSFRSYKIMIIVPALFHVVWGSHERREVFWKYEVTHDVGSKGGSLSQKD